VLSTILLGTNTQSPGNGCRGDGRRTEGVVDGEAHDFSSCSQKGEEKIQQNRENAQTSSQFNEQGW